MKFPTLNLNSRAVIVIAFPLLCHLILVIILGFRLYEIQNYLEAETRSQNIIRQGHMLNSAMVNQMIDDFFLLSKGVRVPVHEQENQLNSMTHQINLLVKLVYNDPKQSETLRRFQKAVTDMTASFLGFAKLHTSTPNWRHANPELEDNLLKAAPELNQALADILAVEERKFTSDAEAIEKAIQALVVLVGIFAVINIAAAVALGLYFALMISNPLEHIRKNGKRLSSRQPLLPVLQGAAEFTSLDGLLHTASKALESALQQNKEMIDNAADIILALNENNEILSINNYGMRLLGCTQDDLIGLPIHSLVSPEQSFEAERYLRDAMKSGKPEVFELQMRTKFGDFVDTRWSCYWSEQHKKFFAVIHDVSEQKRIEQLKEDFANMISHDLRSPLMAMHNSLSLIVLGAKGPVDEKVKADIKKGVVNLDHLMQLVNDLLDFQKLKAGRMTLDKEWFDVQELASQTADMLSAFAEEKQLKIVINCEQLDILCDRQKISQVLTNLVSNAIKFSPAGESIIIDSKKVPHGFEISVSDSGRGIAEEKREKVFELFEQSSSEDEKQGTGLGLAICKLIVEAHHGKIWVETAQGGQGSKFIFVLPERVSDVAAA